MRRPRPRSFGGLRLARRNQLRRRCGITVDDDGAGVPDEERAGVFERFSRGSTASRSGSGLGLTLVAQQAELHGGTAALEAGPSRGARLILRLPDALVTASENYGRRPRGRFPQGPASMTFRPSGCGHCAASKDTAAQRDIENGVLCR
jgi:hypothetical protein